VSLFDTITKRTKAALRKVASPGADALSTPEKSTPKPAEKRYCIAQYGEWREVSREEYLRYVEQANERTWYRIG
jgi:hypothetical protein